MSEITTALSIRTPLPPVDLEMLRSAAGCIVGSVLIVDCVESSTSAWFAGKYGLVLKNPVPLATPIPYKGRLGLFSIPRTLIGDAA